MRNILCCFSGGPHGGPQPTDPAVTSMATVAKNDTQAPHGLDRDREATIAISNDGATQDQQEAAKVDVTKPAASHAKFILPGPTIKSTQPSTPRTAGKLLGFSAMPVEEEQKMESWASASKPSPQEESSSCQPEKLLHGLSRVRLLGAGGFASVFQAKWCHVDVAVKIMLSDAQGETYEMGKTEAQLAQRLRHPNVIQTYQVRRAMVTQEWLDEALASMEPLGEEDGPSSPKHERVHVSVASSELPSGNSPFHGAPSTASASANTLAVTSNTLAVTSNTLAVTSNTLALTSPAVKYSTDVASASMMFMFESNDGFGAPDGLSPQAVSLSLHDIVSRVNPVAGGIMTVIIMELASIGTLSQAISGRMFNLSQVEGRKWRQIYRAILRTMRDIAQGMSALHEMDIVHCDLKPTNVLLKAARNDWRGFIPVVCDFGLSQFAPMSAGPNKRAAGNLNYMAPERFNGIVSKKSDIYAWGIILVQLVTGREPFRGIPQEVVLAGVRLGKLKPQWPEGQLSELQPLYERCVSTDPEGRPSAKELVQVLIGVESKLRISMATSIN